jgi:hypothetical protein
VLLSEGEPSEVIPRPLAAGMFICEVLQKKLSFLKIKYILHLSTGEVNFNKIIHPQNSHASKLQIFTSIYSPSEFYIFARGFFLRVSGRPF